jgi:site-specific DNA recombinase
MRHAALYARVSTANQEEEQTIQAQLSEIKQRIREDKDVLLLPKCIYQDDGWTGTILERPDLDKLRSDARDHKFEVLYVYDRGRLSRKFVHQEIILEELRECGVEFISLHDINGESKEEILMGSVMGVFHEYERLKITERMRLGKVRKVKENKKLLGYNPKYGYDYHHRIKTGANIRDGHFTVNAMQAAAVKQVFMWIDEGYSKHEVRRMLYEAGIAPPKGKRDMWSGGTLDRLLHDTTYYGDHYYNKSESVVTKNPQNPEQKYHKVQKGSRKRRPKEEWMLIKVPLIIEKELYDRVQAKLALHSRINTRNNKKNEYLVGGLIECICGKARTGDPAGNSHLYYRCTDRLSKFPLPRECYENGINAQVFDALVWGKLHALLLNPKLIQQQAERWQIKASPLITQADTLNERLLSLEAEERRYTKAYGLGVMSERLYKDNMKEVADKRSQFNVELTNIEAELADKPKLSVEELVAGFKETLQSLDLTDKKTIIRKIVTKIVATQKEAIIWGHIPIYATEQVVLHASNRHCRFAECW